MHLPSVLCCVVQHSVTQHALNAHSPLWHRPVWLPLGRAYMWGQRATARHCCWGNAFIASRNLSCYSQQVIGICRPLPRGPSLPMSAAMTSSASSRSSSGHSSRTKGPSCRWKAMSWPWLPGALQLPDHGRVWLWDAWWQLPTCAHSAVTAGVHVESAGCWCTAFHRLQRNEPLRLPAACPCEPAHLPALFEVAELCPAGD